MDDLKRHAVCPKCGRNYFAAEKCCFVCDDALTPGGRRRPTRLWTVLTRPDGSRTFHAPESFGGAA